MQHDFKNIEQQLKGIQKVESPYYLQSRIEAEIDALQTNSATKLVWASFLALVLLVAINLNVLLKFNNSIQSNNAAQHYFESIDMYQSNQIYSE